EFDLSHYGSVSSLVSRLKKTLTHDVRLRKEVARLEQQLRKAKTRLDPISFQIRIKYRRI
ncbi:MAG: hypothetical protein V1792_03280, partial [Pseudomonadota bacterium]